MNRPDHDHSWKLAGVLVKTILINLPDRASFPAFVLLPIIQIIVSITRALVEPMNKGHWEDVIYCAKLVLDQIGEQDGRE